MNDYLPYLSGMLNDALSGLSLILPEIALVLTFILVIISGLFFPGKNGNVSFALCMAGILVSGFMLNMQAETLTKGIELYSGHIQLDKISIAFRFIILIVTLLFLLFIKYHRPLQQHSKGAEDLYMLVPAILLGLNLMVMAGSLIMIYISIEMVSIGSYLLVGYLSDQEKQTEAAMKYALFGSACSAIMLYGMSLLYGFTGSVNIADPYFASRLAQLSEPALALALMLVMVGIGFKLSFFPLHFWSPDVYEGAPTPVTAFLSTGPKIAGFALLIRFLVPFAAFEQVTSLHLIDFQSLLCMLAIATMIFGNFSAIWQNNIKRMLAYSSIGHTGFTLMAVVAIHQNGIKSLIFYFSIYALMNMAAFMIADKIEQDSGTEDIRKYKGFGRIFKVEMVCLVVILVSLTGLPPTAGFIAKLFVFTSALEQYQQTHALLMLIAIVTGAITTVVSLFYYFKVPLNAYLKEADESITTTAGGFGTLSLVALILTALVLLLGLLPSLIA